MKQLEKMTERELEFMAKWNVSMAVMFARHRDTRMAIEFHTLAKRYSDELAHRQMELLEAMPVGRIQ